MAECIIRLDLPDANCVALMEKAAGVGMTVEQVLENFIADLVCGEGTNGSDERDLAGAWFDRAGFAQLNTQPAFTSYLIRSGGMDEALDIVADLENEEAELAELEAVQDPDLREEDAECRKASREYIAALLAELKTIFYEPYRDSVRGAPSFAAALDNLREYCHRLSALRAEAGKEAETESAPPDEDSIGQGKGGVWS